jgi:8-oxo-dGTP pyrophosphatase MutT (NUDIX family)
LPTLSSLRISFANQLEKPHYCGAFFYIGFFKVSCMSDSPLRLASTVVLLRDTEQGLEVLLLRRNAKLAFAGGAWVFPGGAIDKAELAAATTEFEAARQAALREVEEECGVLLAAQELVHFCNWTTPEGPGRRFATWFFVAQAQVSATDIVIDQSEIHEFQWLRPQQALDLHQRGKLDLMPPTFLSLRLIGHYQTAVDAVNALNLRTAYEVIPRLCRVQGEMVCLYPGDAGYTQSDGTVLGARHRTIFAEQGTTYIHSGTDVAVPPMDRP